MAELPGLFTPSGNPESVLYPSKANRTQSTDLEKGVLPVTERPSTKAIQDRARNQACGPSQAEEPGDTAGNAAVSADAPDKSRLFSVPEVAYGGLGTFLAFRLLAHDESTSATKGSNTPRADPISRPDIGITPTDDDDRANVEVKDTSPQSMTDPFDYSPTPVREVSWGPGGLAYIVDQTGETLNIVEPVGNEDNATEPTSSPAPGCEVERQKIVDAVQASLHHLQQPVLTDKSSNKPRVEDRQYLSSKHDIQHTVDLVLGLNGGYRQPGLRSDEEQQHVESVSRSTCQRPRLYRGCYAILSGNKSGADSATTIHLPTTSYAKFDLEDNAVRTHSRDRGLSSSTTTVISKRGISKIT
ncbi:hypothetical protein CC79DRAFT_1367933 [Sarocladium strictum]